jgi:TonB family protein
MYGKLLVSRAFPFFNAQMLFMLSLCLLACLSPQQSMAQDKDEELFYVTETPPAFPGGDDARNEFIRKHFKYPNKDRKKGIEGLVVLSFIVEKDGQLSNIKILKGVSPGIDKAAMKIIKKMPDWEPGYQRGKAVRTNINLPIRFSLN